MYDDVECGYGFITSSCSVGDLNKEKCCIGAVYVYPKCVECLEPSKDPSGSPSLDPPNNPSKFSTYEPTGKPSRYPSNETSRLLTIKVSTYGTTGNPSLEPSKVSSGFYIEPLKNPNIKK